MGAWLQMAKYGVLVALVAFGGTPSADGQQAQSAADQIPVPTTAFLPDLTPGYVLTEGDIQVPYAQYAAELDGGAQTDATYGTVAFWPGGVVPYEFETAGTGTVTAANQTAAINAMNAIAARAGVTFRAAVAADTSRIRFQNSTFNNSPLGRQGGVQIINMFNWNFEIIIIHELYHSLGFWHEQSRTDRDTFVTVNPPNICGSDTSTACTDGTAAGQCCLCEDVAGNCTPCAFNFDIRANVSTYGAYDFDSFMHYGRGAFTCNGGDTLTVKAPFNAQWQNAIGQRDHFSYLDAIGCRAVYPFAADRWLDRASAAASVGTFDQPYKDPTLGGALAKVPSGGTLFIKNANSYSSVGTFSTPVTIQAPNGAARLGN